MASAVSKLGKTFDHDASAWPEERCGQSFLSGIEPIMEALLVSTGVVALAEIGDKTQLLALRADPLTSGKLLIALTGYCQIHDRDASIKAGFDHYMTKPIDISRLQTVLATLPTT